MKQAVTFATVETRLALSQYFAVRENFKICCRRITEASALMEYEMMEIYLDGNFLGLRKRI